MEEFHRGREDLPEADCHNFTLGLMIYYHDQPHTRSIGT